MAPRARLAVLDRRRASRASGRELALWATDEIQVTPWLDIDLGLRATTTAASRNGEAAGITWRALSPSISTTLRAFPTIA